MKDFSVLMANYNNANYIAEAIDSVLCQTHDSWELVIIDDCSSDDSVNVIKKSINDERIKFFQNNKNLGYIKTLKKLIEKSESSILGILDSDDALDKTALEKVAQAYDKNSDCGLIYTQCYYCDENLQPRHLGFSRQIPSGSSNLHENGVHHFRTYKRSDYLKTSGYDDDIAYSEDIDLHLKLEEVTKLHFINEPLYYYRILQKSQTHSFKNTRINRSSTALAKLNAYKRRLNTAMPNLTRYEIAEVLCWGMINAALAGRLKLLLKFKWDLFLIHPFFFLDYRFYKTVYNKIMKIKRLKREKPLLGV